MSDLIFIATVILNVSGVLFAGVYIWLNVFSKIVDLTERNVGIIRISRTSMVLSLVFALLSCLLSDGESIAGAIANGSLLYAIIAISWLVVLLFCGGGMLYAVMSKSPFRRNLVDAIKKIFSIALWGAILGTLLSWLLS